MRPPINLRHCLTAATFIILVLYPHTSHEAVSVISSWKISASVHLDAAGNDDKHLSLNLIPPVSNSANPAQPHDSKKDNHHDEMKKGRSHTDEEKHKNHLYHYNRVKRRKKSHTVLVCFALKIFIALSYLSVLICGYMSICH